MKEAYVNLRHLAAELRVGESRAGLQCVFCGGGSSREGSFSLSRPDEATALYICHRASCGKSGRVACWGFRLEQSSWGAGSLPERQPKPRMVYTGTVRELGSEWLSVLATRFGLSQSLLAGEGWGEDADTGELVIPIRTRHGVRCGTYLRQPVSSGLVGRRKVRHYFEDNEHRISWHCPSSGTGSLLVVVEDPISAFKVKLQEIPAAAILGTHLGLDKLGDLLAYSSDLVLALDADATSKSFDYQKQFNIYANIKVAVLDKDLKYESPQRIKEIIAGAV